MAGAAPIYANSPYNNGVIFTDADGTDPKVIAYGNTGALVLRAVLLSNLSASLQTFNVVLRRAAVDYQIARVNVPANSGWANGTPAVNIIDPSIIPGIESEPNTKLVLEASDQLVLHATVALGSFDAVHVVVLGGKVT